MNVMRSAITSNTQSTDRFDVESMSRSRFNPYATCGTRNNYYIYYIFNF